MSIVPTSAALPFAPSVEKTHIARILLNGVDDEPLQKRLTLLPGIPLAPARISFSLLVIENWWLTSSSLPDPFANT